jgi:hypothetical protein
VNNFVSQLNILANSFVYQHIVPLKYSAADWLFDRRVKNFAFQMNDPVSYLDYFAAHLADPETLTYLEQCGTSA